MQLPLLMGVAVCMDLIARIYLSLSCLEKETGNI